MNLINIINEKKARIGIIGLGYVGLPLVIEFCKEGFQVSGFDTDKEKIVKLENGESYIKHIESASLASCGSSFQPTHDFSRLSDMNCIIICVPTPIDRHRQPNLSYVFDTARKVAENLPVGQLIVLSSTTYPGTTDEDMRSILEASGLKAGADFYLAYCPEREDPNNKNFRTRAIPKVVGGYTSECLKAASVLFGSIIEEIVPVSSTKAAEAAKLLENIYRSVNIALVNELKMLFDRMGIDIWEVVDAAKTKPFGFQPFYPGPGLGGHCIPVDPFYLTWKAREYDISTKFIELAGEINTGMPYYVVQKTLEALNERGKGMKGAKILVLGLAYKKDVDDVRESPSLKIIEILQESKARVDFNDPYIQKTHKMRNYDFEMTSVPLCAENLKTYDCCIVVTDHSAYDPQFIIDNSQLVIDTRNLVNYSDHSGKVVKA